MRMTISDNVIWASHVRDDEALYDLISGLEPGQSIQLRIDGIFGLWEKMKAAPDGLHTPGLKPVGAMKILWTRWQARRGETVEVEPAATDENLAYLEGLGQSMPEWLSAEDEVAYGKLQPI